MNCYLNVKKVNKLLASSEREAKARWSQAHRIM